MKYLLILTFIFICSFLYSFNFQTSSSAISSGFSYRTSDKIRESDISGFALQTVIPKFVLLEEDTNLGLSIECANIYFNPKNMKLDTDFFTTSFIWYLYNQKEQYGIIQKRFGIFADMSLSPFKDELYNQYIGILYSQFFCGLIAEVEAGYSITKNRFYISANRDFFLTYIYVFTSGP